MAKTGKPPAFQMYASDFYMDTQELNTCEVGAYTRLLMVQWVNGSLPKELDRLAHIAGLDLPTFQNVWPKFRKKFTDYGDGGMRYVNIRLKETRENLDKERVRKSSAGKEGADVRWAENMDAKIKLQVLAAIEAEKGGDPTVVVSGTKILEKVQALYKAPQYPWEDDKFKTAWAAWLVYKKQTHRFKYKDPLSETQAMNLIFRRFNGNLEFAIEAMELSMTNQWKGIYADNELKAKYKQKKNNAAYGGSEEI